MLTYCNNNPVNYADSNGLYAVAVIYPGNYSGTEEGYILYREETADVDGFIYSSRDSFIDIWNSLESGYYDELVLMVHGDPRSPSFAFGAQSINDIDRGDARSFSELNYLKVNGYVTLCTCYGAKQYDGGHSIAQDFADRVSCMVVATDGPAYCYKTTIAPQKGYRWYAYYSRNAVLKGRSARIIKGGRIMEEK